MPKIQEIDDFSFPSDHLEREGFLAETNNLYPWLKWLLLVVGVITLFHFVVLPIIT